ncbi:MAG: hypothetical protein GX485_01415 [Clostridiales bacterium]|nr:hypothetical protein [Clostridiales bacterium]
MKRIWKLCAAVLAAAALFALTGCSARTAVTADEFKKQAEAQGFKVTDTSGYSISAEKCLEATKSETGTNITYLVFSSEASAQQSYKSMKSSISNGTGGKASNVDSSSYNKYPYVNSELTHTLVRMNKTIIYGKATLTHKNQVDDFMKAVKY